MIKKIIAVFFAIIMLFSLSGCSSKEAKLKDGYYTAHIDGFEIGYGWQEYVTICVSNDTNWFC